MNGLRLTRAIVTLTIPLAFLLLLLTYESKIIYSPEVARSTRPTSGASAGPDRALAPAEGPKATVTPARKGLAATEQATVVHQANRAVKKVPLTPVIIHDVVAGQTLASIADSYATSVETIQKLNGIFDPNYLPVGQNLKVPAGGQDGETAATASVPVNFSQVLIGTSTNGHPIETFVFGDGKFDVVIVGGIHGGYEWNSVLLAYRFLSYFGGNAGAVPDYIKLHIIPTGNPDGVVAVTGQSGPFAVASISGDTTGGRMNGNGVDLNRNWGCDWSVEAQWRDVAVSAGDGPFSEPETRALRDYLTRGGIELVIWLHSAAGLVVPAGCEGVVHLPSEAAAALYGLASGYPVGAFTAYPVSGDAGNWLAQQDIASFTVELTDHQNVEFDRNLRGFLALLEGFESLGE